MACATGNSTNTADILTRYACCFTNFAKHNMHIYFSLSLSNLRVVHVLVGAELGQIRGIVAFTAAVRGQSNCATEPGRAEGFSFVF
jgi:hypothetical protein